MIQIERESQRVREGGSTRAAKQGGLKAEAAEAVTRSRGDERSLIRAVASDEDEGRASRATMTIWTGPISDDERAASDVTNPISVTPAVGSWLEPEALL